MTETIKKYIKYNILWLKLAGLWSDSSNIFTTTNYWKYSLLMCVGFVGTFNLTLIINVITKFDDLEKLASSAYVMLSWVQASAKSLVYLSNQTLLKKMVEQLDQHEFQPKSSAQKKRTFSFMRIYLFVHVLYGLLGILLAPLWLSIPFLVKSTEKKLPFPAWYPYDWKQGRNYYISYVHQAVGLVFVVVTNFSMDTTMWSILAYIGMECDILSDTLRNIHEFSKEKIFENRGGIANREPGLNEMNKILIDCVHHHWKILKFARDSNNFLSFNILIMFASTVLSACMTLFELTVLSPGSLEFSVMAFYQVGVFTQLLVNCWFGNEVVVKSNRICLALYETPWMDCSRVFKRNMLFFLLATQKPIYLYGIKFFVLSLSTFVAILRTCWSVFAMLYQVHNKAAN